MYPRLLLLTPLLFSACDLFNQGRDLIGDLTNPLVTQALVLGVTPPADASSVEMPDEFSEGAGATIFLADAGNVADLENAPIGGATVTLQGVDAPELQAGAYAISPGPLSYEANADWTLSVDLDGDVATAVVSLPPPASPDLPSLHSENTPIELDLTADEYDGVLVVVVDFNGDITYDSRPADIREVYDLARGGPVTTVEIPATAFPAAGAYAVGVAGLRTTTGRDDIEGMNTVLTTMMAGQMVFEPIGVGEPG
ncbi:MAG: hypothetical protein AB8H79_17000 [Myxococcota bacterium]